jgi:hypothetical protein
MLNFIVASAVADASRGGNLDRRLVALPAAGIENAPDVSCPQAQRRRSTTCSVTRRQMSGRSNTCRDCSSITTAPVASHDGPESCVGVREDVGEALTGVRAGWAIEPRNQGFRGADVVK